MRRTLWQPEQLKTTYCSSLNELNRSTVGITQGDRLAISFCATCIQQMTSLGVSKSCWFTDKCDWCLLVRRDKEMWDELMETIPGKRLLIEETKA